MQRSAVPLRSTVSIIGSDKSGDVRREMPTVIVAWASSLARLTRIGTPSHQAPPPRTAE